MPSTKKEDELLKKRLKKLFGNDPNATTKNVKRILQGSPSTSSGKKFFNRKQSSSSIFNSTSLFESSTKKSAAKKKTPNYNCSIIYQQAKPKKLEQKSQTKLKATTKPRATSKKNDTTVEKDNTKPQRKRTKKTESAAPTKKTKKQKDESTGEIEWNPAWDSDQGWGPDQSRNPNCSCTACQTPSDCSCSHCEESRQNGTKKKKKLNKKKNQSQKNSSDFECLFNASEQKSQAKLKASTKSKATSKKNATTVENDKTKLQQKQTKKTKSAVPTKKTKKQKDDSNGEIEWNPAWDSDQGWGPDQSRDPNCSCSACQTPSDCSCSHCEESRQNGTKKKKKLNKKKNQSQKNSCNSAAFECPFNTSDFDSDFGARSPAKTKNASKKANGTKSNKSSKKEKSGTNSKTAKYVKKNSNDDEIKDDNETKKLKEIDLNIRNKKSSVNAGPKTSRVKSNGEDQEKKIDMNLKKAKKPDKIKSKNNLIDKSNNAQLISYAQLDRITDNVDSDVSFEDMNFHSPEYCSDDETDYSTENDFDDSNSSDENDFDYSYNSDEDDTDYYPDIAEDYLDYEFGDFEDNSDDSDYQLPDAHDDLYISFGTAVKYDVDKADVSFDSNCSEAQIVELSNSIEMSKDEKKYLKAYSSNCSEAQIDKLPNFIEMSKVEKEYLNAYEKKNNFVDINSKDESDDSCPQLVPISYEASNFIFESEIEEEEHTSDCYSMDSTSDLGSFQSQDMETEENTLMEPTICTTDDISDSNIPDFLEIERTTSPVDENPFECLMNRTETSEACEVLLLQTEEKKNLNKYESGCEVENFKTEFYNSIDSMKVLVLLKDPIFIYGTLKLQLLAGACEIFGYQPKLEENVEVFSPRGYSFLNIQALKVECQSNTKIQISKKLYDRFSEDFFKSDLDELLMNYEERNHAICLLKRNDRSKKFDMLKKYMKQNLIPNMNSITLERPFYASEFILRCIIRTKTDNAMIVDPNWQTIQIENSTKLMIIGGKSVGKSTLLRYVINKNLSKFGKIVLIDLDIGQPEIFVPQTISATVLDRPLLGPGYFLNLQPKKSILFGDINVVINPFRYLEIIRELLDFCYQDEELRNLPWIVNTMGYNKGVGSEIIVLITKYLKPTDIIQLQSSKEINNFDHIMYPDVIHQIPMNMFPELNENFTANHRLILFNSTINDKKKSSAWDMKPKDMRFAILITRLGAILNERYDWLCDCKPICTSVEDVNIVSFGEDKLSKQDLLEVINANLVYLCKQSESKASLECYGIGIVRGIDNLQQKIYLLPSIYNNLLKNVNCLAVCNIPMPTSLILNQGPKIKDSTPYAYNTNEDSSSKYVTQIYYRPKHFLKAGMKQNAH